VLELYSCILYLKCELILTLDMSVDEQFSFYLYSCLSAKSCYIKDISLSEGPLYRVLLCDMVIFSLLFNTNPL